MNYSDAETGEPQSTSDSGVKTSKAPYQTGVVCEVA
jgi:hypothetical protein